MKKMKWRPLLRRLGKRGLALMLAAFMTAGTLPALAFDPSSSSHDHTGDTPLTADVTEISASGSYYLDDDITLPATLTVTGDGTEVDLCLNGHILTVAGGVGTVISLKDGATLDIYDCNGAGLTHKGDTPSGGKYTIVGGGVCGPLKGATLVDVREGSIFRLNGGSLVGGKGSQGAGVYVNQATFEMTGGMIAYNEADKGGGVHVSGTKAAPGQFIMEGGTICENTAVQFGGGLYADTRSDIAIYGGEIWGNSQTSAASTSYAGGGVYINKTNVTFNLYGGRVTDNYSAVKGGGIYCYFSSANLELPLATKTVFRLQGSPVVTGNTSPAGNDNTYLDITVKNTTSNYTKPRLTGAMGAGARIGITYPVAELTDSVPIIVPEEYEITSGDAAKFFCDGGQWSFALNEETGNIDLCLGKTHYPCGQTCADGEHTAERFTPIKPEDLNGGTLAEGMYYLTGNGEIDQPIVISGHVSLCLEGYSITNTTGRVFEIGPDGILDICDCYDSAVFLGDEYSHTVTNPVLPGTTTIDGGALLGGGTTQQASGGITVDGGTFNLFGGTIAGSGREGGVSVVNSGTFNFYNGTICQNNSTTSGGGVYSEAGSHLNIFGGTISGNYSGDLGGGVYSADGFSIKGRVNIQENYAVVTTVENNVYLDDGVMINIAGAVSGTVGITMRNNGLFTCGGGGIYSSAFSADAKGGTCVAVENGELVLSSYGIAVQPSSSSPAIVMKGADEVRSYQWYTVEDSPRTHTDYTIGLDLSEGDTIAIYDLAASGSLYASLDIETEAEIGGIMETVYQSVAVAQEGEGGIFYVTAPESGIYRLSTASGDHLSVSISVFQRLSVVARQTSSSFTGSEGWYICRVTYNDGVTVFYSVPFYANNHTHPAYGVVSQDENDEPSAASLEDGEHDDSAHDDDLIYTPIANTQSGQLMVGDSVSATRVLEGNYFLTSDILSPGTITISGEVNICLNGHTLRCTTGPVFTVPAGASLTVCTHDGEGVITGSAENGGGIYCAGDATLYGITLKDCSAAKNGGAIYMASGNVTMTDCSVIGGAASLLGGGIYVAGGTLTLCGTNDISSNTGSSSSTSNIYLAQGGALDVTQLNAESSLGLDMAVPGPFTPADYQHLLPAVTADRSGVFVLPDEEGRLAIVSYMIITQPTPSRPTLEVNNSQYVSQYQWYTTTVEVYGDENNPLFDADNERWPVVNTNNLFTINLTKEQYLRIVPSRSLPEDAVVTLTARGSAQTLLPTSDGSYIYKAASTGNHILAISVNDEEPAKLPTLTVGVYTLSQAAEGQTTNTLRSGIGGFICVAQYIDGTKLYSDMIVAQPSYSSGSAAKTTIFQDVPKDAWYYSAVMRVYEAGDMLGTDPGIFSPEDTTTRGMMAAILWRMAGEPQANDDNPFEDVYEGAYYYDAVRWLAETGISKGTDATHFEPGAPVSRQQVAIFFQRYTLFKGLMSGQLDPDALMRFDDQPDGWAVDGVKWAVSVGLLEGKSTTVLDPTGDCTRAEMAAILTRYFDLFPDGRAK